MQPLKTRIEDRIARRKNELRIAGVGEDEIERQTGEFAADLYMAQAANKIKSGFAGLTDEQFAELEEYEMTPAVEKAYQADAERRKNATGQTGGGSWTPNG